MNTTIISFTQQTIPHNITNIINQYPINVHTRLPPNKKAIWRLHKDNLDAICQHCHIHQIPIPAETLLHRAIRSHEENPLPTKHNLLHSHHPLQEFLAYLQASNLIITASDKTPHLCLFPYNIYISLVQRHLQDDSVYSQIPANRMSAIDRVVRKHITNLYKELNKAIPNVQNDKGRSFKILPKLNKHISVWPEYPNTPKTRPVVNDAASITTTPCKIILPYLQDIEKSLPHTCLSAIHTLHKLRNFTSTHNIRDYVIATADISNMYTNIQTHTLLQILRDTQYDLKHKDAIITFLQYITRYTTFTFNGVNYLQKRGLPMGGPVSSVLANIYMSHFETVIMRKYSSQIQPPLLLRYIDDILLLTPTTDMAKEILNTLSREANLEITCTPPSKHAIFLDLKLIIFENTLIHTTFYKFASPVHRSHLPNTRKEISTILSQMLRVWRQNNNDHTLTQQIFHIISFLHYQQCPRLIINSIFLFLQPIETHTHPREYSAKHQLCAQCLDKSTKCNIQIHKFIILHNTLIASRAPFNCLTSCKTILCQTKINELLFLSPTHTIHDTIHNYDSTLSYVMPIGNLTQHQVNTLFHKMQHILPSHTIQPDKQIIPVHIHPILYKASTTYGIPTAEKALKKICNTTKL
jgi:hypothetical protein